VTCATTEPSEAGTLVFFDYYVLPTMHSALSFSTDQLRQIESLRQRLANRIGRPVVLEHDSTDCGQHWAALCVETLPPDAFGQPGPLVTFVTGVGVAGGPEVIDASGAPVEAPGGFQEAVEAARVAALRGWRAMTSPHISAAA